MFVNKTNITVDIHEVHVYCDLLFQPSEVGIQKNFAVHQQWPTT